MKIVLLHLLKKEQMSLLKDLEKRSGSVCELCGSSDDLKVYNLPPSSKETVNDSILTCIVCHEQLEDADKTDANHWRCLNDSMWSEHLPVQVVAYRMLSRLKSEGWPQDLLDMMYLDEETLEWAQASGDGAEEDENAVIHRDVNGVQLQAGDSVVLIKDLKVKGSSMIAKQGTAVRRISLDHNNTEYIEGRVGAQQIVILTKYVKKM